MGIFILEVKTGMVGVMGRVGVVVVRMLVI